MSTDKHRKNEATGSIDEMQGRKIYLRKASYYGMIDFFWLVCLFFFSSLVGTHGFTTTSMTTTRAKQPVVHPLVGTAMTLKDTEGTSIRLSKVFKATHSRAQAIRLIQSGRVSINDIPVDKGVRVIPFQDVIKVDNNRVIKGWERLNGFTKKEENISDATSLFEYVKYWKPQGVTCTTDSTDPCNIIDQLKSDGYQPKQRIYPIGRLDKETTGTFSCIGIMNGMHNILYKIFLSD
jgi:ribosomal 50S subunit-recycling heat shock protein